MKLTNEKYVEVKHQMQGIPYKQAIGLLTYAMVVTIMDLAFVVKIKIVIIVFYKLWNQKHVGRFVKKSLFRKKTQHI